jgi:putative Mg2+ transporter-C (MgtC) family protein
MVLAEIALAMVLGAVIGYEREAARKPAGLRTHMIVAGAAALLVALGFTLIERAPQVVGSATIAADPTRIVQAIIIGIGFLGAGTISKGKSPDDVHGLTTAASLLLSSGVGVAVALQEFVIAAGTTVLAVVALRLVYRVEQRLTPSR